LLLSRHNSIPNSHTDTMELAKKRALEILSNDRIVEAKKNCTASIVQQPRLIGVTMEGSDEPPDSIEISLHFLPKSLRREFKHVFGDSYLGGGDDGCEPPPPRGHDEESLELFAVASNQRAKVDLVGVGDDVEAEKDRLLNVFLTFGQDVCDRVCGLDADFWADYIDPCSGLPMNSLSRNKVYSEVDSMEVLLGYRAYNAGFCKILCHPDWGSSVYPATIFIYAQKQKVIDLLGTYETTLSDYIPDKTTSS